MKKKYIMIQKKTKKNMTTPKSSSEWAGGLCGCTSGSEEECHCCVFASLCPAIMYGLNYELATTTAGHIAQKSGDCGCILPCISHTLVDACVSAIALSVCCGSNLSVHMPLACCLRYTHRRAAVASASSNETKCYSITVETLCYGCSMSQVNRQLKQNKRQTDAGHAAAGARKIGQITGNALMGTLHYVSTMNGTEPSPVV
jgi:hypothetical protein